ncbi:MAG: hypothetical protein ACREPB_10370 [Arenimonas sp.]
MVAAWSNYGDTVEPSIAFEKNIMSSTSLFANVPRTDYLHFGQGPSFNPKAVTELLGLKKQEVSKIAQVAESSVRYDQEIPHKVRERLEEIGSIINLVAGVFDGDIHKTALWFRTSNSMLGDVTPRDMIRLGRYDKLRKFIISALIENNKDVAYARKANNGNEKT